MECQNISDRRRIVSGKIKNTYKVVGVTFAENWNLIILRGRKQQRNHATPLVSGVRTLEIHVRLYVVLPLLCCTTSFLALELVISVLLANSGLRRCVQSRMRRPR